MDSPSYVPPSKSRDMHSSIIIEHEQKIALLERKIDILERKLTAFESKFEDLIYSEELP